MSNETSRRDFLRGILGASAAAAIGTSDTIAQEPQKQDPKKQEPTPAKKEEKKDAGVFKDISFTDQHGKAFKPEELEQSLVVFGYGGCPMCEKITDSVAAIQQKLLADGKKIPIVVISVQPEKDSGKDNNGKEKLIDYVSSYYVKGVKQFANEELPMAEDARRLRGEKAFETARNLPQRDRILHVLCPPDSDAAKTLQTRLGLFQNPNKPSSHSSYITLIKNGIKAEEFRALPKDNSAPDEKFMKELAEKVSASIPAIKEEKSLKR
jgi:cytochrome oxidase Cu insertion factor (SCO1/SenC/PrrC family)